MLTKDASCLVTQIFLFKTMVVQLLQVAGVHVHLFQHDLEHDTPDAVFPNNWFSTHPKGESRGALQQSTLVYYPMKCPNRYMIWAAAGLTDMHV